MKPIQRDAIAVAAALALVTLATLAFQHAHDLTRADTILSAFRPGTYEIALAEVETALARDDARAAQARLRPLSQALAPLMVLNREPGGQEAHAFLARYRTVYRETSRRYARLVDPDDLTSAAAANSAPPRLGDTLTRFIAHFGEPMKEFQPGQTHYSFQPCPGRPRWPRLDVWLDDDRVVRVRRHSCFARGLDPQTAASEAASFLPSDATPPPPGTRFGAAEDAGRSESLARVFSSTLWGCLDDEAPGRLRYSVAPDGYGWTLSVDTCVHPPACGD